MIMLAGACFAVCLAATGVASAFTAPEFTEKAPVYGLGGNVPFTVTIGATYFKSTGGTEVKCTSATGTGEATSPKVAKDIVLVFKGCEVVGIPCENRGPGTKEIETDVLEGELGNITLLKPGLRLYSETQGKTGQWAKFECGGGAVIVTMTKDVIGAFTAGPSELTPPPNVIPNSLKLGFKTTLGIQQYTAMLPPSFGPPQLEWEACPSCVVESTGWSATWTILSVPLKDLGVTK